MKTAALESLFNKVAGFTAFKKFEVIWSDADHITSNFLKVVRPATLLNGDSNTAVFL